MKKLISFYLDTRTALSDRRDELAATVSEYDRRILLLEAEIDEINEVLCALRKYVEP